MVCFCSSPQKVTRFYILILLTAQEEQTGIAEDDQGTKVAAEGLNHCLFQKNRLDGAAAAASTCQKGVKLSAPSRDACLCINFFS